WSMTKPESTAQTQTSSTDGKAPVLGLFGKSDSKKKPKKKLGPDVQEPPVVDKSTFVAGKTLMVEGRLGNGQMLADARGETFLFVDVRADPSSLPPDSIGAQPFNLALVIDQSGSMKGQRQRNAQQAAAGMIQRLRDGDTVSVVTYADQAQTLVPVTTINASSRARILADLQVDLADRPAGHTCISCGIDLGLQTLQNRRVGVDRMILLSDGEANRGTTDEQGIRVLARRVRTRGVTVSSIGVDIDYNERLMSAIAREANGHHYFSETGTNLEEIFDQELENLLDAVAKEGELTVELAPGVRVAEVFDRSYQQVDRRVIVPMGTFSAGEDKTFLMRLEVPPSPAGERPVASVSLRYEDLTGTGEPGECFGE
ncbi:MAG: VWA domain-containing protein, partial [Myxococcales bacterium]|nr:VWA domain-containing protein [Myxococcales bacterium]